MACPSVDVLFNSDAILLTGMGSDGAEGLNSLKNLGFTVTQNVYGMPKAALEIGAAKCVLSLEQITEILSAQEVQFSFLILYTSASALFRPIISLTIICQKAKLISQVFKLN